MVRCGAPPPLAAGGSATCLARGPLTGGDVWVQASAVNKTSVRLAFDLRRDTTHHAAPQLALQSGRHSAALVDDHEVSFAHLVGPWERCRTNFTCRVPLNDDKQEKANRRHAQLKRDSMRASATPNRNRRSLASQDSPRTPAMDQDMDMPDVTGTGVTPMKRAVPLLANFEEWNKLASDNVRG